MAATDGTSQSTLDRRNAARVEFGAHVSIAEYAGGGRIPPAKAFTPVTASDLSQTGVSFISHVWPAAERLVVAFGDAGSATAVARIVNVRSETSEEGPRFDVACEFCEWLSGSGVQG